jgi:hypothetical protein
MLEELEIFFVVVIILIIIVVVRRSLYIKIFNENKIYAKLRSKYLEEVKNEKVMKSITSNFNLY